MGTSAPRAPLPRRPTPLGTKIAAALGMLFVLIGAGITVAAVLPTRIAPLSAEHPPIEDRSGRRARGPGCALNEEATEAGCRHAAVRDVREEAVSFPSRLPTKGLDRLAGTLSVPVGPPGRRPGVVLLGGSGATTRDSPSSGDLVTRIAPPFPLLKALADVLAREGLVVLRFDKRNCLPCYPGFEMKPREFSFRDNIDDGRDALAYLATRPEVDASALVVGGHSEGGHFAPFVAEGAPGIVAVMLLAGTSESFEDGLLGQLDRFTSIRLAQLDLLGAASVALQRRGLAKCFDALRGPGYREDEMCLGGGVTQRALKEYLELSATFGDVVGRAPYAIFALQGSIDRNIDPVEIPRLARLFAGRDAEVHYVPGVSHPLVNALAGGHEIDPEVRARIVSFVGSVAPKTTPP